MKWIAFLVVPMLLLLATACAEEETVEPTATVSEVTATDTPGEQLTSTPENLAPATETPPPPEPTVTSEPQQPTEPPVTNRRDCEEIRGTTYLSNDERDWYLENCTPTARPRPPQTPARSCHPSYLGACLDPNASDYDCAGGTGNGPLYTGRVTVVGPDVFGLDRDGDGIGCE